MILIALGAVPLVLGWLWLFFNGKKDDRALAIAFVISVGVLGCVALIILGSISLMEDGQQ